jgi:YggT family protein
VSAVASIVYFALTIFLLLLVFRLIMEYVFMFARSWRPGGAFVVVLEAVYSITDPPLKFLRRYIPPLRLGGISLDLSFLVLFIAVSILRGVAASYT